MEDCYSPERSPLQPGAEHALLANALVAAGCDLLLCETFPHVGEALAAVEAAASTGAEVWVSFTAGYKADLLTPDEIAAGAREAVEVVQMWERRGYQPPPIDFVETRCKKCYVTVDDQFLSCECSEAWRKCARCERKYCAHQRCACSKPKLVEV